MGVWRVKVDVLILALCLFLIAWVCYPAFRYSRPLNILQWVTVLFSMSGAYFSTKTIRLKIEAARSDHITGTTDHEARHP